MIAQGRATKDAGRVCVVCVEGSRVAFPCCEDCSGLARTRLGSAS